MLAGDRVKNRFDWSLRGTLIAIESNGDGGQNAVVKLEDGRHVVLPLKHAQPFAEQNAG